MARGTDDYDGAWIEGGTARIPARGEPFGGPLLVDDTPPEIKVHLRREERKDGSFFAADNLAELYGRHQTALSEARKTTTLAGAKGLTERVLKAYDADVLTTVEGAPSDEARQRFTDDALDLRRALETGAAEVEYRFQDMGRRSALEIKAGALGRQAEKHPEDYPLHAAMLDKVVAGAAALVKPENAAAFRRVEAEKMARSAMMGFIEQGRFDEGRALLATASNADGGPGPLPLSADAVKELGGVLETRRTEAAAREERLDRVDTVLEGKAGPTDDGAEWQALVEEHFSVVAPQMAELEPAGRIEVEDDYVRNLGHLPQPLMRSLRAGILSGEAEHEAAAALRIKTLADHDPALVEVIPEAERARAQAIAEFAELGLKPERAVKLGDERLTTQDTLPRLDESHAGPWPHLERPGYVWENGRWRPPETPEEARDKFQPLSKSGDGAPAADGGETADSDGEAAGDGDESPTDETPAHGDSAGNKDNAGTLVTDKPSDAEPKELGDKDDWGGLPPAVPPMPNPKIRDDDEGDGRFGTWRKGRDNKRYKHQGVDLEVPPGAEIKSPVEGKVDQFTDPYRKNHPLHGRYETIWIRTKLAYPVYTHTH